jgi:hypothetical protein
MMERMWFLNQISRVRKGTGIVSATTRVLTRTAGSIE